MKSYWSKPKWSEGHIIDWLQVFGYFLAVFGWKCIQLANTEFEGLSLLHSLTWDLQVTILCTHLASQFYLYLVSRWPNPMRRTRVELRTNQRGIFFLYSVISLLMMITFICSRNKRVQNVTNLICLYKLLNLTSDRRSVFQLHWCQYKANAMLEQFSRKRPHVLKQQVLKIHR